MHMYSISELCKGLVHLSEFYKYSTSRNTQKCFLIQTEKGKRSILIFNIQIHIIKIGDIYCNYLGFLNINMLWKRRLISILSCYNDCSYIIVQFSKNYSYTGI